MRRRAHDRNGIAYRYAVSVFTRKCMKKNVADRLTGADYIGSADSVPDGSLSRLFSECCSRYCEGVI